MLENRNIYVKFAIFDTLKNPELREKDKMITAMGIKTIEGRTYYNISYAAELLGVSRWTLARWIAMYKPVDEGNPRGVDDTIEIMTFPSGRKYILADSLEEIAKKHQVAEK